MIILDRTILFYSVLWDNSFLENDYVNNKKNTSTYLHINLQGGDNLTIRRCLYCNGKVCQKIIMKLIHSENQANFFLDLIPLSPLSTFLISLIVSEIGGGGAGFVLIIKIVKNEWICIFKNFFRKTYQFFNFHFGSHGLWVECVDSFQNLDKSPTFIISIYCNLLDLIL